MFTLNPKQMKQTILNLFLLILATNIVAQIPGSVKLPEYDSIQVKRMKDSVYVRKYFMNNKRVAHAAYKVNYMMSTPFSTGYIKADSAWTVFNDLDYTHLLYQKDTIEQYLFLAFENMLKYSKFMKNGKVLESGNYYVMESHYISKFDAGKSKYKIGLWEEWDRSRNEYKRTDYDKGTIDGIKMPLSDEVTDYIRLAKQKLKACYGEKLVEEHFFLNLDRTKISYRERNTPNFPSGKPIFENRNTKIKNVDLSYDIILGKKRYCVVEMRMDSNKTIVGKAKYRHYKKEKLMTKAFDNRANGVFHENLTNWRRIADGKGIDMGNDKFTTFFKWENCEELNCALSFFIKGLTKVADGSGKRSYHTIKINPWTGQIEVIGVKKPDHGLLEDPKN